MSIVCVRAVCDSPSAIASPPAAGKIDSTKGIAMDT